MGPQLHTVYNTRSTDNESRSEVYTPNELEKIGDTIIKGLYTTGHAGLYTTPLWVPVLLQCCSFYFVLKVGLLVPSLILAGIVIRGLGRYSNKIYIEFLRVLSSTDPQKRPSQETMKILRQYDFDFSAWPVNFKWSDIPHDEHSKCRFHTDLQQKGGFFTRIMDLPSKCIALVLAHTIGRAIIYPGSLRIAKFLLHSPLLDGRKRTVEIFGSLRNKLITSDDNSIDTMFIDRRRQQNPKGKTLVICCEGNAGYYEFGTYQLPLKAGFSALAWNHPGFA